ncbi:MAG: hypothetical protein Q4B65_00470 [Candidatus Saccharibacteria bacterium]|nr:hypothetical protein [Candidatus Saccharibacteria bacterium]
MKLTRPSVGFCTTATIDPLIARRNGFRFLDEKSIISAATAAVLIHFKDFQDSKIEHSLFEREDSIAIETLNREILSGRKEIAGMLAKNFVEFSKRFNTIWTGRFCSNIDKLYALKEIIREAVSPKLFLDDYVICGRDLPLDFPISYEVSDFEGIDVSELFSRALKKRELFSKIRTSQESSAITRDGFCWMMNPFLVPLRFEFRGSIKVLAEESGKLFTEFELSMQLLKRLVAYKIEEIWNIPDGNLSELSGLSDPYCICEAFEVLRKEELATPKIGPTRDEITKLVAELKDWRYSVMRESDRSGAGVKLPFMEIKPSPFSEPKY